MDNSVDVFIGDDNKPKVYITSDKLIACASLMDEGVIKLYFPLKDWKIKWDGEWIVIRHE